MSDLTGPRGPKCRVGLLMNGGLPAEDVRAIAEAVEQRVPWADLARVLRQFGHRILAQSVARHFKGECACPEQITEAPTATSIGEALNHLGRRP